jgi:DNA-binding NarL/FixJ family response regulator
MYIEHKVGVVEDQSIFRQGLCAIINSTPNFQVVFDVEDGLACVEKIEQGIKVHLLIVDYRLPGMNGIELCYLVKKRFPLIKVILTSMYDDKETIDFLANAADGFISKDDELEVSFTTMNAVINNERHFPKRSYDNYLNDWFEDA